MYKIMIVEDDEIISNSIAGYLQKWQYATHEVVDFQNVVKEFVEQSPDLVLMSPTLMVIISVRRLGNCRKFL